MNYHIYGTTTGGVFYVAFRKSMKAEKADITSVFTILVMFIVVEVCTHAICSECDR